MHINYYHNNNDSDRVDGEGGVTNIHLLKEKYTAGEKILHHVVDTPLSHPQLLEITA